MGGSELTGARGTGEERETETEARGGRRRHCSCCCRESSHPRPLNTPPPLTVTRGRPGAAAASGEATEAGNVAGATPRRGTYTGAARGFLAATLFGNLACLFFFPLSYIYKLRVN